MSLVVYRPSVIATIVTALCGAPTAFADSGSGDEGGLATDPLPAASRTCSLTDAQVSAFGRGLRGETECGVAALLGRPDTMHPAAGNDEQWHYRFGWQSLVVSIRSGRVCGVSQIVINREEQERQTGVREDDFVGVIGP